MSKLSEEHRHTEKFLVKVILQKSEIFTILCPEKRINSSNKAKILQKSELVFYLLPQITMAKKQITEKSEARK